MRFATDRGEVLVASPRPHVEAPAARWLFAALVALVALRAVVAAHTPVIDDEAYYWIWSRHLRLSYLDHPPLVAWLDALVTSGARTEWLLRVPAMLATLATTVMLYGFGRDLFGRPAGIRAAALHAAIPVFALQAIHAIPDPLLYACWTAGLWAFWRALHGDRAAWWWCGLSLGAGLLSKYPMAVLAVTWLLVLAWPRYRHVIRTPGPYLAVAIALVLGITPVAAWNARHGWAALWFWLRAGQPGGPPLGGAPGWDVLREAAVQFGYAGPLAFPLLLWAVWMSCRLGRRDERFAYLALAALPTLLLVAAINLGGINRPNWPAPAYLAAAVALGALWPRRLAPAAVASGLVLSTAAAVLIAAVPWLPPALRWTELYGWREVSLEMVRRAAALADAGHVVLLGPRYNEASYVGYYTEDRVPVSTGQFSEFSFLAPPHRYVGWQGIAAIDSQQDTVRHGGLVHDCARLTEQPPYAYAFPGGGVKTFRIFHCVGFRGTPPAP